jgi:outer membrane receptor protein involved in Fe transport
MPIITPIQDPARGAAARVGRESGAHLGGCVSTKKVTDAKINLRIGRNRGRIIVTGLNAPCGGHHMKIASRKCGLAAGVSIAALIAVGDAHGQSTAPTARDTGQASTIEEVVVTANKREETLHNVAMSVSVVSGAELARTQTLDLQDLEASVPGLSIEGGGPGGGERITLRGLNSGGDGANVTTVVDNVPLSYSLANTDGGVLASDFDTYDLERIEVLRGPQGTLYGADAEGGIVKYVTNPPDLTAYHFGIEAGADDIDHGGVGEDVKGYANIPLLNDTLAIRASGYYETLPGWIGNPLLNGTKDNLGRRFGGRFSALWRPISDLTIRGTAFLQERNAEDTDAVNVYGASKPGDSFGLVDGYNKYHYNGDPTRNRLSIFSLDANYNLHWATLESITSYGIQHESYFSDRTTSAGSFGPGTTSVTQQTNALNKFNQEVRLSSNPASTLFGRGFDWQFGVFYTHEVVTFDQDINLVTSAGALPGYLLDAVLPSTYHEVAGYGDLTYHFTPKFDVEIGGRVSADSSQSQIVVSGVFEGGGPFVFPQIRDSDTSGTFSFASRYHFTDDVLSYIRIASGFRPGGPELPVAGEPASVPLQYGPDSTLNYEIGLKADLFDKRVSLELTGFYITWKDIQIPAEIITANGDFGVTGNGGSAASEGAEFNLGWRPITGLHLGFVGAYTDAHLTQNAPGIGGLAGQALAYVPKLSTTVSGDYEWPIHGDTKGFVGGSWSHIGSRYSDFSTNPTYGHKEIPSYETLSARLGIRKGAYTFEIYGKNLTDARGVTYYSPSPQYETYGTAYLIRPLTIGFRVASDF